MYQQAEIYLRDLILNTIKTQKRSEIGAKFAYEVFNRVLCLAHFCLHGVRPAIQNNQKIY